MTRNERGLVLATLLFLAVWLLASIPHARSRDLDGRYQHAQHHDWVKSLHSPAGAWCCDLADGEDAEWQTADGHYQVRRSGAWVDVPLDAVIGEPNRIGRSLVWFVFKNGTPIVNCFLPGPMT